jgi:hypothetical protein
MISQVAYTEGINRQVIPVAYKAKGGDPIQTMLDDTTSRPAALAPV